ncbi:hypothetical protein [Myxosarcina sp. GI1(2024)]
MLTFLKSNLRRIAIACLLGFALLVSSALTPGNFNRARAEVLKRDAVNLPREESADRKAEYEAAKANRRAMQAQMSQEAEKNDDSESVSEKLNLNEPVPQSTKKFFKQIEREEPIENETRP